MKSHLYHIQVNIDFKNLLFYKDLFTFMGWTTIFETDDTIGFNSKKSGDVWFVDSDKKEQTDYDKLGMNHLAIRVENQKDIDELTTFIKGKGLEPKFETPRHRSEFSSSPDETYYQVMFVSPDNILFEAVFIGVN